MGVGLTVPISNGHLALGEREGRGLAGTGCTTQSVQPAHLALAAAPACSTGTWQGIYLNEHRDHGGPRRLIVTLHGQTK